MSSCVSISIKSEIDSRVLLYPLMRCLKPLGSILIVTSNKQVSRLIDGDLDGEFRNFHIIIDTEGATDELLESAGVMPNEYTYVVYDNVGVVEQDKLLIPIGPIVSEDFHEEMMYLGEDRDTHIIRFGKPMGKTSTAKSKSQDTKGMTKEEKEELRQLKKAEAEAKKNEKKNKGQLTVAEQEERAKLKFQIEKEDVALKIKKLPNMKFPTFENFEMFESSKQFFIVDRSIVKCIYTIFKGWIGLTEPNYMKEVTRKDARSDYLGQVPADR